MNRRTVYNVLAILIAIAGVVVIGAWATRPNGNLFTGLLILAGVLLVAIFVRNLGKR